MTTLNFEFPNTEIRCSSFPPPRQLVYSSPVSVSFRPSSSMFSILTAFLSLFSPYVLSSVFVHIHPTHTHLPPHLQAVPATYPQARVACLSVRTFVLHHLCSLYSHPPLFLIISRQWTFLVSYWRSSYSHPPLPPLQKVCALVLPDICSSYSPPPLLCLSPDSRCIIPFLPLMIR